MDPKAKEQLKASVDKAVQTCLAKDYASKDAAIDAVIADLEALKGGPEMGGLGNESADMTGSEGEEEE